MIPDLIRWTLAALLAGVLVLCAAGDFWTAFERQRRFVSMTPLIGAVTGVLARLVRPIATMRERLASWWVPVMLGLGTGFLGVLTATQFPYACWPDHRGSRQPQTGRCTG